MDGEKELILHQKDTPPNYGLNKWSQDLVTQEGVVKSQGMDMDEDGQLKSLYNRYEMPNGQVLVERRHVGAQHTDSSGAYLCLQDEATGKVLPESYWSVNEIKDDKKERDQ